MRDFCNTAPKAANPLLAISSDSATTLLTATRWVSFHCGIDHGSINPANVFAPGFGRFTGACAGYGGVWFAQRHDCCPSLEQIILPKRFAVHRRVGWIGIQLTKCTGD